MIYGDVLGMVLAVVVVVESWYILGISNSCTSLFICERIDSIVCIDVRGMTGKCVWGFVNRISMES